MTNVAWYPQGMAAPAGLLVVKVPSGPVTERQWEQALMARLEEMVNKEPDPSEAIRAAARALNLPGIDEPQEAGMLFRGNLQLQTALSLAVTDKDPFPGRARAMNREADAALRETTLQMWVEMAADQVSASSLD